ncbi:Amino acid transporter [Fasciola gigantica]|uniref:Amino acid transporter n=1 Tax=Fasciola gigantica TaxID=46835 RepID=A0A504Y728_FASGI|nr:Amino acid transporter [Fasciola gigantica]
MLSHFSFFKHSGLADLDTESCGKIGSWAMGYYVLTTMMAVILGIVLVVSIHPGSSSIKMDRGTGTLEAGSKPGTLDAFLDLLRNLFPENIVQACTQQVSSRFVNKTIVPTSIKINTTDIPAQVIEVLETHYIDTTNVLGKLRKVYFIGLIRKSNTHAIPNEKRHQKYANKTNFPF